MRAYCDTSALLRLVLRDTGALDELRSCEGLVSSELIAVESYRTIDRLRLQGSLSTEDAVVMATHDAALGLAARAFGFEVRGI